MDLFALTNMTGYSKAGNPQNLRPRRLNLPAESGRSADLVDMFDGIELSSIHQKTETGETISAGAKQPVFADIVRAAYERRKSAGL